MTLRRGGGGGEANLTMGDTMLQGNSLRRHYGHKDKTRTKYTGTSSLSRLKAPMEFKGKDHEGLIRLCLCTTMVAKQHDPVGGCKV